MERVVKRPVSALATYIRSTIPTATTTANGYMSKTDKAKLAGVADGATNVVVDTTFSSASSNPASSKAIATVLDSRHPVGSIIMSIVEISPATIYGGTWVAGTLPVIGGIAFDDGTMVSDIFVYKRTG